jgi:CheY-like chemotaxis protein
MQSESNHPPRVLVVDDEAHIVQVAALKLRNAGYEVATAGDGEEALAALRAGPFALVLTDLQMPMMNGIELARAMGADPALAGIPVVLLTARGHLLREGEADGASIRRVIAKPFSPRALLAEIEEVLGASSVAARRLAA